MESFNKVDLINKTKVDALIKKERVIVYYGNSVLDVTDFKHPGPDTILIDNKGKDIKMDFDDQGHSTFAKSLI
jgi:cytochrome b involved in lipid metabolism